MADFLQGYQCRRISLDRALDGRTNRTGCEEGEEKCDVCLQSESGKEAQELSTEEAETASPSDRRVERGPKRQWSSIQEFQQQEGQLREMKRARRAATTTSLVDLDQLHTKFVTWSKVGCLICWAQGQQEWTQQTSASWQSCQQHSSSASQQMEAVFEKVKALHCEKYSGCLFC